ncbi:hypothetical protein NEC53_001072 [Salmonella enterica]|nr:hypothetical protein [Salmonella enterica]
MKKLLLITACAVMLSGCDKPIPDVQGTYSCQNSDDGHDGVSGGDVYSYAIYDHGAHLIDEFGVKFHVSMALPVSAIAYEHEYPGDTDKGTPPYKAMVTLYLEHPNKVKMLFGDKDPTWSAIVNTGHVSFTADCKKIAK